MLSQLDEKHHLRATPRYKLFQPAEMCTGSVATRVHILNLSAGGALMYASNPPAKGTILRLRCGDRTLPACVAWTDERRFGVAFVAPLASTDVDDVIAAQDALVSAVSRRVRFHSAQTSPELRVTASEFPKQSLPNLNLR